MKKLIATLIFVATAATAQPISPGENAYFDWILGINPGNNVFLGPELGSAAPGLNITSGQYNTGIGVFTQANTTTGGNNTSLGFNSALQLTSGFGNNFFGVNAGQNLSTANYTVNIGQAAGLSNIDSSGNVFVGGFAGWFGVHETTDTGIGYAAFSHCFINGVGANTGVGYAVGTSITSGGSNTFVGANAGTAYTSGSEHNDIILGLATGTPGENNTMHLGDYQTNTLISGTIQGTNWTTLGQYVLASAAYTSWQNTNGFDVRVDFINGVTNLSTANAASTTMVSSVESVHFIEIYLSKNSSFTCNSANAVIHQ